jgi:hypothetical protein
MACTNPNCPDHASQPPPINKLGECKTCHEARLSSLRGRLSQLPQHLSTWFGKAEQNYGKCCFYSADIERMIDAKDPRLKEFGMDEMKFGARIKLANNGASQHFVATSKNFELMANIKPSEGIRSFVDGRFTVCECEGMIKAVIFNALCDFIGEPVFDAAFANLRINGSGDGVEMAFIDQMRKGLGESDIDAGDWTFVAHTTPSAVKFRDLAQKNKKGGAASGWNLICAEGGGPGKNTYYGFGLSGGQAAPKTLAQVKKAMIEECGGDPADFGWELYLHFRRQVNGGKFLQWLDKGLRVA